MKLFFAAPLSGLPSDPIALGAPVSRVHFAIKAVRAAPARSRPSFLIALLSHVPGACAAAEPIENAVNKTASMSRVTSLLHPSAHRVVPRGSRKKCISRCKSLFLTAGRPFTLLDLYL